MLGDKIKEWITRSNHIIIKYIGVPSVDEAYKKERMLYEKLEELQRLAEIGKAFEHKEKVEDEILEKYNPNCLKPKLVMKTVEWYRNEVSDE